MLIVPVRTGLLDSSSDLAEEILKHTDLKPGDILVVSSKAVATCEGAAIDLKSLKPSAEALKLSKKTGQDARFAQAVVEEMKRLNGRVVGTSPSAILTELRPSGMKGVILCPNAGMDQSNVGEGHAVGWPREPVESAQRLREALANSPLAVIISDSCCIPTREGVTAFALACAGINPLKDQRGSKDMFGKELRVTQEAVADQLAVAANAVMGNAAQSTPAAIIRDHGFQLSDFVGWVDGIEPDQDLFKDILSA